VRPWYEAKKARDDEDARRVVVAVMRKLALALYHVGVQGEAFQARRLFGGIRRRHDSGPAPAGIGSRREASKVSGAWGGDGQRSKII